jgi:hypothetical protein
VVEIVKRYDLHKFFVLPKRWIVERMLTCISRNRRLARDFERYARTVAAFASGIRAPPRGLLCGAVESKPGQDLTLPTVSRELREARANFLAKLKPGATHLWLCHNASVI